MLAPVIAQPTPPAAVSLRRARPRGHDGRFVPKRAELLAAEARLSKTCGWCRTNATSQWRVGPTDGSERMATLCNACGINYRRALAKPRQAGRLDLDALACAVGPARPSIQKAVKRQQRRRAAPRRARPMTGKMPTSPVSAADARSPAAPVRSLPPLPAIGGRLSSWAPPAAYQDAPAVSSGPRPAPVTRPASYSYANTLSPRSTPAPASLSYAPTGSAPSYSGALPARSMASMHPSMPYASTPSFSSQVAPAPSFAPGPAPPYSSPVASAPSYAPTSAPVSYAGPPAATPPQYAPVRVSAPLPFASRSVSAPLSYSPPVASYTRPVASYAHSRGLSAALQHMAPATSITKLEYAPAPGQIAPPPAYATAPVLPSIRSLLNCVDAPENAGGSTRLPSRAGFPLH